MKTEGNTAHFTDTLPASDDTKAFIAAITAQSEDEKYLYTCKLKTWTLRTFVALVVGLTSERLSELQSQLEDDSTRLSSWEKSQLKHAHKIITKFKKTEKAENSLFLFENNHCAGFNYLWIKWLAEKEVFPSKKFFNTISHELKWIYCEFQPNKAILRAGSKLSQAYHSAYFEECMTEILSHFPGKCFTPKEVYDLPQTKKILNQIRAWRGKNYKERTVLESWLPTLLGESKRGRPSKKQS